MKATWFAAVFLLVVNGPLHAAQRVSSPSSTSQQVQSKINLNTASAQQLANSLTGIGPKRAEAIVNYREKQGFFKSLEDLANVRGLGRQFVKKNLAKLQQRFTIG